MNGLKKVVNGFGTLGCSQSILYKINQNSIWRWKPKKLDKRSKGDGDRSLTIAKLELSTTNPAFIWKLLN